jgi:hypothetical protein
MPALDDDMGLAQSAEGSAKGTNAYAQTAKSERNVRKWQSQLTKPTPELFTMAA